MRGAVDLLSSVHTRLRAAWPASSAASTTIAATLLVVLSLLLLPARSHLNILNVSLIFLVAVVLLALFADRRSSAVVAFLLVNFVFSVRMRWLEHGFEEMERSLARFASANEIAIDPAVVAAAAPIMSRLQLKSNNAVHVAATCSVGVTVIATTDTDFARVTDPR